eukprot:jgi/Ulvmu1/3002/UM015_0042.1
MWLVGALLSVAGSIMLSAGMGAMKAGYAWQKALAQMDQEHGDPPRPIYRIRTWQTGAALYMSGNILQFLSYAFAAQSLLLALSSVQFAAHLLCAWLMERAVVPLRSMAGAAIIILSNLLLVVFSSKSSALLTANELVELYKAPPYVTYQVIAALLCLACGITYCLLRNGSLAKVQAWQPAVAPAMLALGASLPGTQTLILTKAVSMMFVVTVGRQNQMGHWYFWVAAVTPFASAAGWTAAMQHGLATYPSAVIVPLLQVAYTAVGVLCGVLFFQEYRQMPPLAVSMFVIGFLGMFGGICLSVSPDALAAGIQEMQEKAALPASDPGSCDSVSSAGGDQGPPVRRATFFSQQVIQTSVNTARSTVHGAALASIGMGAQHKLRCASIFVSPLALSPTMLKQNDGAAYTAAVASGRVSVARKPDTQRRGLPLLPTLSEELEHDHNIAPGSPDRGKSGKSGATGAPAGARHSDRRGGASHKHSRSHKGRRNRRDDEEGGRAQAAGPSKAAISQLDLLSQGSAPVATNSGDYGAGSGPDATQLSTVRVVPAAAGLRQAARSVSQLELAAPLSPLSPATGFYGMNSSGPQWPGHTQGPQAWPGHARDVVTNMAFSAELWSTMQKQQLEWSSAEGRKYDNPLAFELHLQRTVPSISGRAGPLSVQQMPAAVEAAPVGACMGPYGAYGPDTGFSDHYGGSHPQQSNGRAHRPGQPVSGQLQTQHWPDFGEHEAWTTGQPQQSGSDSQMLHWQAEAPAEDRLQGP